MGMHKFKPDSNLIVACVGNASGNTATFFFTATFEWLPLEVGAGNFTYVYMT